MRWPVLSKDIMVRASYSVCGTERYCARIWDTFATRCGVLSEGLMVHFCHATSVSELGSGTLGHFCHAMSV
eukprot:1202197-Rhodomonas_salina.1